MGKLMRRWSRSLRSVLQSIPMLRACKRAWSVFLSSLTEASSPAISPEPPTNSLNVQADEKTVVSQQWGKTAAQREKMSLMGWMDAPLVLDYYVLPTIAQGSSQGNAMLDIIEQFPIDRQGHWLSLGCGSAGQEIFYSQNKLFASMDAYDISEGAIQIARANAEAKGITNICFQVQDINKISLPPTHYDVVSMIMSLHHVSRLGYLLDQVERTLKPNGWFLVNEFIGPSQFQFSAKQMQIVNELLALLPERLAFDYVKNQVKRRYDLQPRDFWDRVDPSEAIHSDQIEAALHHRFQVVSRRNYGGTLLNPLLEHIVGNFAPEREEDVVILRLLMYIEAVLIREGCLKDNFALFVMKKKHKPFWSNLFRI